MFKVGNKIKCINNKDFPKLLTNQKEYEVLDTDFNNDVLVTTDLDFESWMPHEDFELVSQTKHKTIVIDGIKYNLVPVEE